MQDITYTTATKIEGSCTKGHKWEYDPAKLTNLGNMQPTIQIGIGKTWCLLCIEEFMAGLIGEVE